MSFDRYSIYGANLGGILLRDLFDLSVLSNTKKSIVIPGGDVHPRAIVTCCADPVLRMSTKDLNALFAGNPKIQLVSGHRVHSGGAEGTTTGLFQFQKRADGGTFEASNTNSHIVMQNSKGFVYLESIAASQDDERGVTATINYAAHSVDGEASPFSVFDPTQLSATVSPLFGSIFYLGPVRIGQVGGSLANLPGVRSWSLRAGIDYRSPRADGKVFAQNGSINAIVPEITIETLDCSAVDAFLTSFFARGFTTGSAFNFFLRKGVHGGLREADASAVHFLIVANTGENQTDEITVQGPEDGMLRLTVRPTGGLVVTHNQAIV